MYRYVSIRSKPNWVTISPVSCTFFINVKKVEVFEAVALPNSVSLNALVSFIRNTLMTFTLL